MPPSGKAAPSAARPRAPIPSAFLPPPCYLPVTPPDLPLAKQGRGGTPESQGKEGTPESQDRGGTQSHRARRQGEQQKGGLKAAHTGKQMDVRVSLVGPSSPRPVLCSVPVWGEVVQETMDCISRQACAWA